ncbi:hypothetical protein AB0F17_34495 [Nonomuraea sp. NPDC026600]|uniref:hypothetical protein n=1 Tax=Nonomuraea sp. NPDC026600 TaxID=3155363 RepID=UPI0033FFEAE6
MNDTIAPDVLTSTVPPPRKKRLDVIARALTHIGSTPTADLIAQLADTSMHDHLRENSAALADFLRSITIYSHPGHVFGGWKAAQKVLRPAGLPHD